MNLNICVVIKLSSKNICNWSVSRKIKRRIIPQNVLPLVLNPYIR